ncbi:MAG: hypothetical protein IJZ85_03410 [Lachnospiraceae bacterium]|nr:hypothetical protein [Lachnospiraceae bacterium]
MSIEPWKGYFPPFQIWGKGQYAMWAKENLIQMELKEVQKSNNDKRGSL